MHRIAIILTLCLLTALTGGNSFTQMGRAAAADRAGQVDGKEIPLSFKSVIGTWALKYGGNYGYHFSFYANYRALIILYLSSQSLVFRGVYTIEDGNKLKVNISEMKNTPSTSGVNLSGGFVRAKSSYFLFSGYTVRKGGHNFMYLRPRAIIIDGNNSEGYFEPLIKLSKN